MLALLIALSLPASASTREVGLELGWVGTNDPRWDLLGGDGVLASWGIRGGVPIHKHLALVGGWQHAAVGGEISLDGGYDYDDEAVYAEEDSVDEDYYYSGNTIVRTGFWSDQVTFGVKADKQFTRWFGLYATVQGTGMHALVKLDADEDRTGEEDPSELTVNGWTGGLLATGGVEFTIPLGRSGLGLGLWTEFGYEWNAPMELEQLGSVQFAGFAGRAGTGIRF